MLCTKQIVDDILMIKKSGKSISHMKIALYFGHAIIDEYSHYVEPVKKKGKGVVHKWRHTCNFGQFWTTPVVTLFLEILHIQ